MCIVTVRLSFYQSKINELATVPQEIKELFVDEELVELQEIYTNPYHTLSKGDQLLDWIFCINCGKDNRPIIFEKILLSKNKDIEERIVEEEYGGKIVKTKKAFYKGTLLKYCEVLNCNYCKEILFRVYEIYESQSLPQSKPTLIPQRNDKAKVENISSDSKFVDIYERYCQSIEAYNMSLFYAAGVSNRSILELLCEIRGHFNTLFINKSKVTPNLTVEIENRIKRNIGLEEQVNLLIDEIKTTAPNHFDKKEFDDLKNMMYWGHKVVHGKTFPTIDELKTSYAIIEEIFDILYFDVEKKRKEEQKVKERANNFTRNNSQFSKYSK
jgi:hypothetical protein